MNNTRNRRMDRRNRMNQEENIENRIRQDKTGTVTKEKLKMDTKEQPENTAKDSIEEVLDTVLASLEADMDRSFMETGKTVAELFRAVTMASLKLPVMELHTKMMCFSNTEDGITIVFTREPDDDEEDDDSEDDDHDCGCDCDFCHELDDLFEDYDYDDCDDCDDEEEGMIYDGD